MSPALLGAAAALSWGTHDFLARYASRGIGYLNTVLAVTAVGLVVLTGIVFGWGLPIRLEWEGAWILATLGIGVALATMWLFAALEIGPISIVAAITASYPALAVTFAFLLGSRPTPLQWAAMAGIVVGLVVVARAARRFEHSGEIAPGMRPWIFLYSALASVSFAVALTAGQYAAPIYGEVQSAWLGRFFGLALIVGVRLVSVREFRLPRRWLPLIGAMGVLDALALVAVVAAGFAPNPEIATVVSSTFGTVAILLARFILREPISLIQWLGIGLIFSGVVILTATA